MKISFRPPEKRPPIGTTRLMKNKFLWWPKILRKSLESDQLELRVLCRSSWVESMDEWLGTPPDYNHRGGYSPSDLTPDTYGWRGKYWVD